MTLQSPIEKHHASVQSTVRPDAAMPPPGGNFSVAAFLRWSGMGRTSFYRQAQLGNIVVSKIGRASVVTWPNALAWRDALPSKAA